MIKKLLATWCMSMLFLAGYAQVSYQTQYVTNTTNPGGLNTTGYSQSGWSVVIPGGAATNSWSATQTMPFPFEFFGTPVTHYKVSGNGLVTFDTNATALSVGNYDLPTDSVPDLTICGMWDEFSSNAPVGSNDAVVVDTFGVAPNRQFWIKWFSYEYGNPSTSFNYWSVVLEETTNKVYVVDHYGFGGPLTGTVGVQKDNQAGISFGDNLALLSSSNNSDDNYWEFDPFLLVPGNISPTAMTSPSSPVVPGSQPVAIDVYNTGSDTVTSFTVNWTANGLAQTPFNFSGSLAPFATVNVNLGNYNVASGFTNFEFITDLPNGGPDGDPTNDTLKTKVCTGLSGVYTLGAGGSFQTFDELATDLANCGISGAVTVNVMPGVYDGGVEFPPISGSSSANRVTIDGGGTNLVTVNGIPSKEAVFQFTGADFFTIKNMSISNTRTSDSWGVHMSNESNNNSFDSLKIDLPNGGIDVASFVASGSITDDFTEGINANFTLISNCIMTGGERGIVFEGDDIDSTYNAIGNAFINNVIMDYDDYGIYMDNMSRITITGNTIVSSAGTGTDGIYCFDLTDFFFTENFIDVPDYGMYIADGNFDYVPFGRSQLVNNMVISASDYGIYIDDVELTDVFHNTTFGKPGFYMNDNDRMDIRNNIFTSDGDYAFESPDTVGAMLIDYNLYYTVNNDLIKDGPSSISNTYVDLASWKTAVPTINGNSVSADPVFVGPNDLHCLGVAANDVGDNSVPVQVDIDGEFRPFSGSTIVDMGADEFDPPAIDGFASKIFVDNFDCGNDSTELYVVFGSQGLIAIDTINVTATVDDGTSPINFSTQWIGNLTFPNTDTLFLGTFNSVAGGDFALSTYLDIAGDSDTTNNSVSDTVSLISLLAPVGAIGGSGCSGQDGYALGPDAKNYRWFTDSVGGTLVGAGDSISFGPLGNNDTTIWIAQPGLLNRLATTMAAGNGCGGGNMIDIKIFDDLTLEGVDANIDVPGPVTVYLYYILNGTYNGNETNPAAWTLWDSVVVNSLGTGNPTEVLASSGLALNAGDSLALYFQADVSYTTGANVYSNSDMEITAGIGLCSPFGGTNNPRTFNGAVIYSKEACSEARNPVTVTVIPGTNPDFSTSVSGYDVTFTDLSTNPDSIRWDFGDGNTSTASNPTNSYAGPGTYYVCLTSYSANCGGTTFCDSVVVACVPPVADYTYASANGTVSFTDASTNADSVMYDFGDGNTSTLLNPVHVYAANGVYNVCQTAYSAACGNDVVCYSITITGIGIEENFIGLNNMYPNPTNGALALEFGQATTEAATLRITDIQGRVVMTNEILAGVTLQNLDVAHLDNGQYIIIIESGAESVRLNFIKQD